MAEPKLNAKLGLDKKEFDRKLKEAEGGVTKFGAGLRGVFAAAGLAIGLQSIIKFGAEAYKLAAKAGTVKTAFDRLNSPTLLDDLRRATQNTVADVELMTNAIRANNFRLPLEQLPKYFEFATRRARETGESVNYLVDSIVLGISRQSPKILDNLGLSLTEINDEFRKTGNYAVAVGNIAERELGRMGKAADDAYVKNMRLGAAWENLKTKAGENSKRLTIGVTNLTKIFETAGNDSIGFWRKLWTILYKDWEYVDKIVRAQEKLRKAGASGGYNPVARAAVAAGMPSKFSMVASLPPKQITTLQNLNDELALLEEQLLNIDIANTGEINSTLKQIEAKKKQIDAIMGVVEAVEKEKEAKRTMLESDAQWNSLVGRGLEGKAGTWGALGAGFPSTGNYKGMGSVTSTIWSDPQKMSAMKEMVMQYNESLINTQMIASNLEGVFSNMFSAMGEGWSAMADALIDSIRRIAQEIIAKAAVWAIMAILFPTSAIARGGIGAFIGLTGGGGGGPSGGLAGSVTSAGNMNINITGKTLGRDITYVVSRGGNSLYGNT